MKVLGIDASRFASPNPTGVELYADRMVEGLVKHASQFGYDQIRFFIKDADQLQQLLSLVDQYGKKDVIQVKLIEHQWLWTLFWLSCELFRHPVQTLFVPAHTLPLVLPKRVVWTPHGLEGERFPEAYSRFQRLHRRWSIRWARRRGAQFIAISKSVKEDLMHFFHIHESRIHVIPHGFDHRRVAGGEVTPFVKGPLIFHIGRLEVRKNQLRLVKAFTLVAREFPDFKLVLVGAEGYGSEEIRKAVECSPVSERIFLAGYLEGEAVDRLWKETVVFVYPSLAEGFGIPILEAFDQGVPVLTSKGGATEEVGGQAAVYCNPLSVKSIAEGLRELLKNAHLQRDLKTEGKKRLELFSWEESVTEVVKLLRA